MVSNDYYSEVTVVKGHAQPEGSLSAASPEVGRISVELSGARLVSGLQWGAGPQLVLLHGGGQNAHTWDGVAVALARPLIAFDLPGHGHSSWRGDGAYGPHRNAEAVAEAIAGAVPFPTTVVGTSLGGLTAIALAAGYPGLVRRAVVVDATPGIGARAGAMTPEQRGGTSLISGRSSFDGFEEMLQAASAATGRSAESLRRGVRHNARQLADGRWNWRYDRLVESARVPVEQLWDELATIRVPVMLVRGARSGFVHVSDEAEFLARQPSARVEHVEGAGHSVQSDRAAELAGLIANFMSST